MRLRRFRRAVALGIALAGCFLRFWFTRLRGPLTLERRARWLQSAARSVLASLGIRYSVEGQPPESGLVVSNHLSYLDIVLYSAAMPCFFVSKVEVKQWPYFGKAARAGGTIFLDRSSHASATAAAAQIAERLTLRVPVLLFPEGTSTDGSSVLRFHARLIQPATQAGAPVTAAAIRYVLESNVAERELCWYGDAPFLSHLWKVLGAAGFTARIHFGEPQVYANPRLAAEETHALVAGMRAEAFSMAAAHPA
ncbi:MAG TPA: lysophospholipid acyltransferase family protein [Terracidiphilus sp.]|nr:lysophospholipid acyltransferase family protein [Terracidiphilus sp.]